jgi:copper homeostasis protein (lipoprotein)
MACNNRPMSLLRRLLLLCLLAPLCGWAEEDTTWTGSRTVLTLFADHSYRLRTRSGDAPAYDIGRWARGANGTLLLRGGRGAPLRLNAAADGVLRVIDPQGQPIEDLQRQTTLDRIDGSMRLRGLYFYLADAASFQECLSGRRWPVLIAGAHRELERAYLSQGEGGRWVLATLEGRFVMQEPEPGLAPREAIVVEHFDLLWPGETCAADAPSTATLLNTRWRLVQIDGQPVRVAPEQREPWLQLLAEGNRARGHTGCNGISGRFEQGSDGFLFKQLDRTPKACSYGATLQEAGYLAALQATASRQIVGDALQLRDAQGRVRLLFEALYLR